MNSAGQQQEISPVMVPEIRAQERQKEGRDDGEGRGREIGRGVDSLRRVVEADEEGMPTEE